MQAEQVAAVADANATESRALKVVHANAADMAYVLAVWPKWPAHFLDAMQREMGGRPPGRGLNQRGRGQC